MNSETEFKIDQVCFILMKIGPLDYVDIAYNCSYDKSYVYIIRKLHEHTDLGHLYRFGGGNYDVTLSGRWLGWIYKNV